MQEKDFNLLTKELENLLNQGETAKVVAKADEVLRTETLSILEAEKVHAFKAWGFYRQKEFEKAKEEALQATDVERGIRCLAAMASYLGNPEEAKIYLEKLSDSPGKANSRMIGLRNPEDKTPKEEVLALASKWIGEIVDKVNTANLMNNTARWILDKGSGKEDLMLALGFMRSAIELYGTGSENMHHRASANFWISKIMEKLFGQEAAIPAATESLTLWDLQLSVDPDNSNYIKSRKGAEDYLNRLIGITSGAYKKMEMHEGRCVSATSTIILEDCTQEEVTAYGNWGIGEFNTVIPVEVDVWTTEVPPLIEVPMLLNR